MRKFWVQTTDLDWVEMTLGACPVIGDVIGGRRVWRIRPGEANNRLAFVDTKAIAVELTDSGHPVLGIEVGQRWLTRGGDEVVVKHRKPQSSMWPWALYEAGRFLGSVDDGGRCSDRDNRPAHEYDLVQLLPSPSKLSESYAALMSGSLRCVVPAEPVAEYRPATAEDIGREIEVHNDGVGGLTEWHDRELVAVHVGRFVTFEEGDDYYGWRLGRVRIANKGGGV